MLRYFIPNYFIRETWRKYISVGWYWRKWDDDIKIYSKDVRCGIIPSTFWEGNHQGTQKNNYHLFRVSMKNGILHWEGWCGIHVYEKEVLRYYEHKKKVKLEM
jgi:hypothetical protein